MEMLEIENIRTEMKTTRLGTLCTTKERIHECTDKSMKSTQLETQKEKVKKEGASMSCAMISADLTYE